MHKCIHLYGLLDLSKMGPIGCPETFVRNYHSVKCKIPKHSRSHLHNSRSLK